MSMQTKPCAACKHVRYFAVDGVHACEHPSVAVPSNMNPKVLISVNVTVLRSSGYCLGKRQCGPDGLYFEERPAQDPMRQSA